MDALFIFIINMVVLGMGILGVFFPIISIMGMFTQAFVLLQTVNDSFRNLTIIVFVATIFFSLIGISRRWIDG